MSYAFVWSVSEYKSYNNKITSNEPKNVIHKILDPFLD